MFKATHLPNVDKKGCSDPYTTLAYQGKNITNDNFDGSPKGSNFFRLIFGESRLSIEVKLVNMVQFKNCKN